MSPGTPSADPAPCALCDGFGRLTLRDAEPARETLYLATAGASVVDTGTTLDTFVRQLLADWDLTDEDLAVWLAAENGPRLVAVVRPGVRGPAVTYL